MIAQKRQCFLHNEQRAANIDIECGVELSAVTVLNGSMRLPTPALAKMTSMCPFSSCSLICEAERRAPAIGARDHEAGCRSFAPMKMSHSMMASSPNITGKTQLETLCSYRGHNMPVTLVAR